MLFIFVTQDLVVVILIGASSGGGGISETVTIGRHWCLKFHIIIGGLFPSDIPPYDREGSQSFIYYLGVPPWSGFSLVYEED